MPKRHYTIYCDESATKGELFSDFYGGVLLRSREVEAISNLLNEKKDELNLQRELKWTRITENYLEKYLEFVRYYFSFINSGRLKTRIMFTQNIRRARNLAQSHHDEKYFLLYYQLIKNGFGLKYSNPNALDRVYINLLLDDVPDTKEKFERFRTFVSLISETQAYHGTNVYFPRKQIAGIDSKSHVILQGLDIILGSMQFRLNKFHERKPEGARRRGKRTIAKEKVYKEINRLIREIRPGFNVGASTGADGNMRNYWTHPYRHWLFVARDHELVRKNE